MFLKKQTILTGYLLLSAAICFWISWFLMPDPGTTDTQHILAIVKQSRQQVLWSVTIQVISSVLYAISLFMLVRISFAQKITMAGIALLGIGAMGLCVDAFFHLLAYYMTGETVTIQEDVVRVMNFMQTDALFFLVPLLLPFFIGSLVTTIGLNKQGMISAIPKSILIAAFLTSIISMVAAKVLEYEGNAVILTVLGLFAAGQIFTGIELIRKAMQETGQPSWGIVPKKINK